MISLGGIIALILFGAVSGWITAKIMHNNTGFWQNVLLGIIGSIVGGFLLRLATGDEPASLGANIVVAVFGACLVTWLYRRFAGSTKGAR